MRVLIGFILGVFLTVAPALAKPVTYDLGPANSKITFTYQFYSKKITGRFKSYAVDLKLDFEDIGNSSVAVTIKTRSGKGGFPFATGAMLGPKILDAKQFPEIRFVAHKFRQEGAVILIDGKITLRGITKPLTLTAQLVEKGGTDPNRQQLKMRITGTFNRHDFGASGFKSMVGSVMGLTIIATVNRK